MPSPHPPAGDTDRTLFLLLLTCAHRLGVEAAAQIDSRVTVMGLVVIHLLVRAGAPPTSADVADALGCSRAAATQTLARLEREGLVERKMDERDNRARRIHLTAAARALWEQARRPIEGVVEQATITLAPSTKEQMVEQLVHIEDGAARARAERKGREPARAPPAPEIRSAVHVR